MRDVKVQVLGMVYDGKVKTRFVSQSQLFKRQHFQERSFDTQAVIMPIKAVDLCREDNPQLLLSVGNRCLWRRRTKPIV